MILRLGVGEWFGHIVHILCEGVMGMLRLLCLGYLGAVAFIFLALYGNVQTTAAAPTVPIGMAAPAVDCAHQHTPADIGTCVGRLYGPNGPYGHHMDAYPPSKAVATPLVTGTPAEIGAWSVLSTRMPLNVVHSIVGPFNKALLVAGSGNNPNSGGVFKSAVWDFATNQITMIPTPSDLFCAGQSLLPNGDVLVVGGTKAYPPNGASGPWQGDNKTYVFKWSTMQYVAMPNMTAYRWYGGTVTNADGDKIVTSGLDLTGQVTPIVEMFHSATNTWTQLPNRSMPMYANIFLTGRNTLFYTGVHTFGTGGIMPGEWNPVTNSWRPISGLPSPECWDQGVALPLFPSQSQRVMAMGGGCTTSTQARTAIVDLATTNPQYISGPSLSRPAMHICGLMLPSGDIFKSGGGSGQNANPVLDAEVLAPGATAWKPVASPTVPRMYHSSCVLRADGSVATMGSNQAPFWESRIEIYKPWYMFMPNRPTLTGALGPYRRGSTATFNFTAPNGVADAVLLKPSAVTHQTDADQRGVTATASVTGLGRVAITFPAHGVTTPSGIWYLVIRDSRRVPSAALVVRITP